MCATFGESGKNVTVSPGRSCPSFQRSEIATVAGQTTPQSLGQLTIANFINEAGLQALGSNLFQQTAASGQPTVGVPGDTAFGVLQQGYLEASNVDPVSEITNLISAQRAYEMNSKVIQAADQMSGTISTMRS